MKRVHLPIGIVLATACIVATPLALSQPGAADVPAQEPRPGHGPDHGHQHGRAHGPGMEDHGSGMHFLGGVRLTEAQQDRVFAILHAQAPQRREQEKTVRKTHQALREMEVSGQVDDARAAALAQKLGQAVAAETLQRVRTQGQILALLTPEQRDQLRKDRAPRSPRP